MIPLKDNVPRETFPFTIFLLIFANVIVFLYEISLGKSLGGFIYNYGIIPKTFLSPRTGGISQFSTLITSMFLHGGWLHLLGNMWFLWVFGDNIEDRMGHSRFPIFYLLCGIAGGLAHIYINPGASIPSIGASGAISGVLGAYFILYPFSRVNTLVPVFFFFYFIKLPAFFFLGLWFLIQFFSGAATILVAETATHQGVAWWAHIGGFAAGVVLLPFFLIGRKKNKK
jgi:membrane associated rhomboid family serine protease